MDHGIVNGTSESQANRERTWSPSNRLLRDICSGNSAWAQSIGDVERGLVGATDRRLRGQLYPHWPSSRRGESWRGLLRPLSYWFVGAVTRSSLGTRPNVFVAQTNRPANNFELFTCGASLLQGIGTGTDENYAECFLDTSVA